MANRQFTQSRCYQCKWVRHPKCLFCVHTCIAGTQHVAKHEDHSSKDNKLNLPTNLADLPNRTLKAEREMHEDATEEMLEGVGNGTLAHRRYWCPSLASTRRTTAPNKMIARANQHPGGDMATERALLPAIDHIIPPPPPSPDATFYWELRPPTGLYTARCTPMAPASTGLTTVSLATDGPSP